MNPKRTEKLYMNKVAELGCIICRRLGYNDTPAELHHPRTGMGIGQRAKHFNVIPLCHIHHRSDQGVHGMGTRAFAAHYGVDEAGLLDEVRILMGVSDAA